MPKFYYLDVRYCLNCYSSQAGLSPRVSGAEQGPLIFMKWTSTPHQLQWETAGKEWVQSQPGKSREQVRVSRDGVWGTGTPTT